MKIFILINLQILFYC